ncbi:hypothetical protein P421_00040 [Heyndrickxia coagulans P38]|uniref:hypothetical protein n=1 Tax=Heyndrickxia coagulans TaxID=1398 RepID=UPI000556D3BB|nr:hypothetical protein [Heyndrickxia coagulans]KGT40022.1 hypothetical protein P421_00040 [Heyndrickxia coagulans P38]NMH83296.1 hypothetical protein [Heyndrickxia coagulans]
MNQLDFLPEDLDTAIQHYRCCYTCLAKAEEALVADNLQLAEKRMEDFKRSLDALHWLKRRKEQKVELRAIIAALIDRGVDVEKVVMR